MHQEILFILKLLLCDDVMEAAEELQGSILSV